MIKRMSFVQLVFLILAVSFIYQLALFGEIITAQKVMYEKFGDTFLANFVSKCYLAAHCPQELAEQYRQKLQVMKTLADS